MGELLPVSLLVWQGVTLQQMPSQVLQVTMCVHYGCLRVVVSMCMPSYRS